jgi:hypothetical protein
VEAGGAGVSCAAALIQANASKTANTKRPIVISLFTIRLAASLVTMHTYDALILILFVRPSLRPKDFVQHIDATT